MINSMMPLISIVIPTYNHAHYLGCALQSVLDQTYENWEAIVIDNYSTDKTNEILMKFTDPRIIHLKIHNNGVIAASRNAGINKARGEWIAFLDSDDWWVSDKLQNCYDAINEKVDFIYHYLEIASNKPNYFGRGIIKSRRVQLPIIMDLLVNGNPIVNSSVLVRKRLLIKIGGINENKTIIAAEDYSTWLRIAELTNQFLCLPLNLGYYRVHEQNTSGATQRDMSIPDRIVTEDFRHLLSDGEKIALEARFSYTKGRFNYFSGNYKEAAKNLFFALCHHKVFLFRLKAFISLAMLGILKCRSYIILSKRAR